MYLRSRSPRTRSGLKPPCDEVLAVGDEAFQEKVPQKEKNSEFQAEGRTNVSIVSHAMGILLRCVTGRLSSTKARLLLMGTQLKRFRS